MSEEKTELLNQFINSTTELLTTYAKLFTFNIAYNIDAMKFGEDSSKDQRYYCFDLPIGIGNEVSQIFRNNGFTFETDSLPLKRKSRFHFNIEILENQLTEQNLANINNALKDKIVEIMQPPGYAANFIENLTSQPTYKELIKDLGLLPAEVKLFVAADILKKLGIEPTPEIAAATRDIRNPVEPRGLGA